MNHLTKLKLYLRSIPHHMECGKHSNFRYCCIFDYSVIDNFNHTYYPRIYRGKRYVNKVINRALGKDFGYIPCPVCMLFRSPRKTAKCAGVKHRWAMPMDQLRQTVDWGNFTLLSKNLRKIEAILDIIASK